MRLNSTHDGWSGLTRISALALSLWAGLVTSGCQRQEEITRYSVTREETASAPPSPSQPAQADPHQTAAATGRQRMLAAIVPRGDQSWFFKMVGPEAGVSTLADPFQKLIASITFVDKEAPPDWKLPAGWKQKAASGMRYATIEAETPKGPVELTVTPLRTMGGLNEFALANVNRWRQQVGLEPTTDDRLFGAGGKPGEMAEVKLAGGDKALVVDLSGESAGNTASMLAGSSPHPPMAGPGGLGTLPGLGGPAPGGSQLGYKTPEGWVAGKAEGMRQAAFEVKDGARVAEITAIALAAGSGDLLSNVNRWREQVKLPPVAGGALDAELKPFEVDGAKGQRVVMIGPADARPREGIVGVICSRGDQIWFFKMKGDADLVQREGERFDGFVRSVKFKDRAGAADHGK